MNSNYLIIFQEGKDCQQVLVTSQDSKVANTMTNFTFNTVFMLIRLFFYPLS